MTLRLKDFWLSVCSLISCLILIRVPWQDPGFVSPSLSLLSLCGSFTPEAVTSCILQTTPQAVLCPWSEIFHWQPFLSLEPQLEDDGQGLLVLDRQGHRAMCGPALRGPGLVLLVGTPPPFLVRIRNQPVWPGNLLHCVWDRPESGGPCTGVFDWEEKLFQMQSSSQFLILVSVHFFPLFHRLWFALCQTLLSTLVWKGKLNWLLP